MTEVEKKTILEEVDIALEAIRPHLKVDGGDIEVVEITDDMVVRVKWLGTCEHCAMSIMTMKAGVEQAVKTKVPQIKAIEAINGLN